MEKKKSIRNVVLKTVANVVEISTKEYIGDWPPLCSFILHQPKRPKNKKTSGNDFF